jgi:uncharacterized membrane protein YidH (DUF202 family)
MSFFPFIRIRTPVYQNTGSVARDHLASERTYLAWMRTGLGFIALGIAIERFQQLDLSAILPPPKKLSQQEHQSHRFKDSSELLIGALLGTGSGSIVYGTARYFSNMRLLDQGMFKPAFHGVAVMSVGVTALAATVFWSTVRDVRDRKEHEHES